MLLATESSFVRFVHDLCLLGEPVYMSLFLFVNTHIFFFFGFSMLHFCRYTIGHLPRKSVELSVTHRS
jgi:hypothetical protein